MAARRPAAAPVEAPQPIDFVREFARRQRASRCATGDVWQHLAEIDEQLVSRGWPAMSHWWRETLAKFYASGKRQLVLRVGRRGGKSSTLCRVAVAEALYGAHVIPPGDVGVVAIVSIKVTSRS